MLRFLNAIAVTLSLLLIPASAYAQASIVGAVKDSSGAVLPGVAVEASSPVLIEKTRSVVTSGTGQYSIENLRPGVYTVTFSLPGFTTVKRDGIELTGNFIATVNGELRVGGLAETVVVTGESPIVDVTSARTSQTLSGETVANIPSSRQYFAYTQLIPAVNAQGNDVGGALGPIFSVFQVHGGRRNEGQVQVDGQSAGFQGMGVSSYVPEVANQQEVTFSLSGGLGEAVTGGPQMNIVGKQGGNRFTGSFFVNLSGSGLQANNVTQELKNLGLTVNSSLKQLWDINPAFGGPILRDRLWFFGTYRYQGNRQYVANIFANKNAGDPTKWTYDPDFNQQAVDDGTWKNGSVRLTWQPTPRNKINGWMDEQYICQHCIQGGSFSGQTFTGLVASPEGQGTVENHPNILGLVSWQSPVTSRVLVEASWGIGPYFWWGSRQKSPSDATLIPVQDDGLLNIGGTLVSRLNYRGANWSGNHSFTDVYQGSLSYITGSHTAKVGFRVHLNHAQTPDPRYNDKQLKYNFQLGIPYQLTMYADQASQQKQDQNITALYVQDRWTLGRLSLQGGLRFERLTDHFPQQQLGPSVFLPNALVFPDQDGPRNLKDIQPRFGVSYDVFGNGKTGVKFFLGRYVTTTNTTEEGTYSPAGRVIVQTTRGWTDRNQDYVPNCNLLNPAGQNLTTAANYDPTRDTCGPMANPFFGQSFFPLTLDPSITSGWNKREYSWDLTAGVMQQVAPRVSVEVDYVRRTWGNLLYTVNRATTPADFDPFVFNVPADSRLPGGGNYSLTLLDPKIGKFGQFDNFRSFSDDLGGAYNNFNGVDVTVNARLRYVTMQGGTSSGNVVEDECGLAALHPDIYVPASNGGTLTTGSPFIGSTAQWPASFCHRESTWLTNLKGLVSYTVPKVDVLVSGTFHSLPYPGNNFPSVANQSLGGTATVAPAQTTLGRAFSNGQAVTFLNIVKPGALYGDRLNDVDLRLGKILKYGRTRTLLAVDIFNLFNSSTPDVYSTFPYGATYLNPLNITSARFAKISAQIDF
jgi:Carboxypeptidase regulatory-like domain